MIVSEAPSVLVPFERLRPLVVEKSCHVIVSEVPSVLVPFERLRPIAILC
jgi:hypothetical protein